MCRVTAHTISQLIVKNTSLTKAQLSWWGFIHWDKSCVEDCESHIFKRFLLLYFHTSFTYNTVSVSHSRKVVLVKALIWLPSKSLHNNRESGFIHDLCNSFAGGSLSSGLVFFVLTFIYLFLTKLVPVYYLVLNMNVHTKQSKLYPFLCCDFVYLWPSSTAISAIIG